MVVKMQNEERYLKRNLKNFTYSVKQGDKDARYIQYICKFKDGVSYDEVETFCNEVAKREDLPRHLADSFRIMSDSDVINFSSIISSLMSCDKTIEDAKPIINSFLNMFDFGNKREKTADRMSKEFSSALTNTFGNPSKSRRLVAEIESASANREIVDTIGNSFIINNYVGDLKGNHRKEFYSKNVQKMKK